MGGHQTLFWIAALVGLAFVFAFGAIVGSFLNVVIYRLPEGKGLVRPPSACPACGTRLRWNDNFPIFGWFLLRGRCRYCKTRISIQYVLIEILVALIFATTYALWFMNPTFFPAEWRSVLRPDWAFLGIGLMWPMFILTMGLVSALIAITIIDARTFLIPLIVPTSITLAAFVFHPIGGLMLGSSRRSLGEPLSPSPWTIPVPEGGFLGLAFGGVLGIAIAIGLLSARLLPRSFADYEAWEKGVDERLSRAGADPGAPPTAPGADHESLRSVLYRTFLLTGPAIALMSVGLVVGQRFGLAYVGLAVGTAVGLAMGMVLRSVAVRAASGTGEPIWLQYPHARREMLKEVLFLVPCLALAGLGWWLTGPGGPLAAWGESAPLWLRALGGSFLGFLAGGGVVWAIRILGTLGFGKEAMGAGDVHLMAMVGAVQGWIDPLIAFMVAPILGIAWTVLSALASRSKGGEGGGVALPYGPHLAVATLVVVFAKPGVEWALSSLWGHPVDLP